VTLPANSAPEHGGQDEHPASAMMRGLRFIRQDLSTTERLVAFAFVAFLREDGTSAPGTTDLLRVAGISRDSFRAARARLLEVGVLRLIARNTPTTAGVYAIDMGKALVRVDPPPKRRKGFALLAELRPPAATTGGNVCPAVRSRVYERDHYACRYCRDEGRISIDHVVPRSRGGAHDEANLVTACIACNVRKGPRTPTEAGMTLLEIPA
jgi:hypothetical protein